MKKLHYFHAKVVQFRFLPINEKNVMRKFAEKGFEFCRCWIQCGEDMQSLDAAFFGVSPDTMRLLVFHTVKHLTGAKVIPGLNKKRTLRLRSGTGKK